MYWEEKRPGWLFPGIVAVVLTIVSLWWYGDGREWRTGAALLGFGVSGMFWLSLLVNLFKDFGSAAASQLYTRRQALSMSQDSEILKSLHGVHPETIRAVFGERQRAWMIKAGMDLPDNIGTYWVLYARPDVTEYFVWHFLTHSNSYRCMPKRDYHDKTYQFDPLKKVTDREQYDMLVDYLQQRHVLTTTSPQNGTPLWITPWNPAMIAEDLGLEWNKEYENTLTNLAETEGAST